MMAFIFKLNKPILVSPLFIQREAGYVDLVQ